MKKLLALLLALTLALSLGTAALADHVYEYDLYEAGQHCENPDYPEHLQPGESYILMGYEVGEGNEGDDWGAYHGLAGEFLFWDEDHTTAFPGPYSYGTIVSPFAAATASPSGTILPTNTTDGLIALPYNGTLHARVSADWSVGGAMVKSVKFVKNPGSGDDLIDQHGTLVLELNENYTIDTPKRLIGVITLTEGKETANIYVNAEVCNHLVIIDGYSKLEDAKEEAIETFDNTIYKCSEDAPGYVVFNANSRLFSTTLKMVKNEKAFMFSNEDMIDAVEEMYGNLEADIECYQFGGSPTFTNEAAFSLQADYADQYFVYEWSGQKLIKVDYEWDSINGLYKWATKSPTDYVISDKELVMAEEEVEKNPDTGAGDLVGMASALAVVSLIAVAAVSRKK